MIIADAFRDTRTRPFVCGAIGHWVTARLQQLVTAAPQTVPIFELSTATLRASDADSVSEWKSASGHGFWWGCTKRRTKPEHWKDVGNAIVGAGLSFEDGSAVLHTDAYGLEDVFIARSGGAVYFSSLIEPLIPLLEGNAHTDWTAWADIFALGYPVGVRTQFKEIQRIPYASGWKCDPGLTPEPFEFEPLWVRPRNSPPTPKQLADILGASISRRFMTRPHVTLSGGWDSRLLAAIVRRKSLRSPIAWTTSTDDGFDLDIELSTPVAKALGLTQRLHVPPESSEVFIKSVEDVQRRTEFQSWMHTWLVPLAQRLHLEGCSPLYDGLAGDVLLKSLYVDEAVMSRPSERRSEQVWRNLSSGAGLGDERIFGSVASLFIDAESRRSFEESTERVRRHAAESTLQVLLTRTMRGIALSPRRIFGPECDVRLPFLDADVVLAALAVPVEDKIGGNYYRELLRAAAASVAHLTSTNDPQEGKGQRRPRRQALPRSLEWTAEQVKGSPDALSLLSPSLRPNLDRPEGLHRVSSYSRPLRLLQSAALLARWQATYADSLVDIGSAPWNES